MSNYWVKKNSSLFLQLGLYLNHPKLQWINLLVSKIYICAVIPFVKKYLSAESIYPRRSVLTFSDFNIFFSDLDLGIIISDSCDLKILILRYNKLKNIFPFLGEIEIYTRDEYQTLNQLLTKQGAIYSFFRDIRKIGWMEQAYASAPSKYHAHKALRGIQNCLNRLGVTEDAKATNALLNINLLMFNKLSSVISNLSSEQKAILNATEGAFSCPYFGRKIIFSSSLDFLPFPNLSSLNALLLFALTPPLSKDNNHIDQILQDLRKNDLIFEIYQDLTIIEFTIFKGYFRSLSEHELWQINLLKILETSYKQLNN